MKIIVGLGNIGKKYEHTVHNMGFVCIDKVAKALGVEFKQKRCHSMVAETVINGEKIVLAKPETYMNESGTAVKELIKNTNINLSEDLLIISDDFDLKEGEIRFKIKGSAGTHNGLRDIVEKLQTTEFKRLRIGVGRPPEYIDLIDFVLSSVKGNKTIDEGNTRASEAVLDFIRGATSDQIMQKYN